VEDEVARGDKERREERTEQNRTEERNQNGDGDG